MAIPEDEILKTEVAMTVVGGKILYEAAAKISEASFDNSLSPNPEECSVSFLGLTAQ